MRLPSVQFIVKLAVTIMLVFTVDYAFLQDNSEWGTGKNPSYAKTFDRADKFTAAFSVLSLLVTGPVMRKMFGENPSGSATNFLLWVHREVVELLAKNVIMRKAALEVVDRIKDDHFSVPEDVSPVTAGSKKTVEQEEKVKVSGDVVWGVKKMVEIITLYPIVSSIASAIQMKMDRSNMRFGGRGFGAAAKARRSSKSNRAPATKSARGGKGVKSVKGARERGRRRSAA